MKQKVIDHKIFHLLTFCLIAGFILFSIGCGGSSGPSSSQGVSATLAWDAPTKREDGSTLQATDIAGYKLYYGTSSMQYTDTIDVGNTTSYSTGNLPPGTFYIAVTVYDNDGIESDYSAEISAQID